MEKSSIYGNWRAQVVDNKDPDKFGRVLIWIPDFMPEVDKKKGIWARPANNPIGGRNTESEKDHHYMGSSYIPKKGAWVFVFFEGGNINLPYYFGALDLENTKVLPENQLGDNYEDKWTLLKTHEGRAIVISDDPDDERTEITGKKRMITTPPTGDKFSVYRIDENQNTILLDERDDTEKLLIKTHKGDFIKLGIKDRTLEILVASNIEIRTGGHLVVTSTGDQHFLSGGNIHISAAKNIDILSGGATTIETGDEFAVKCGASSIETVGDKKITVVEKEIHVSTKTSHHLQAAALIARDAGNIKDNTGESVGPPPVIIDAIEATEATPTGYRDKS